MSVPDDYILTGTYQQKVERLGRMVPPLMMKAVAENIYREILTHGNT
jgi:DNA (cytosine-5)-methyltransferase 1